MTRYTVVWIERVQGQLANAWLASVDREAVSAASHLIDQYLATDPAMKGEAVSESLRALIVAPLKAMFVVFEDDRRVEIVRVRLLVD